MDKLLKVPEYDRLAELFLAGQSESVRKHRDIEIQFLSWLGAQLTDRQDYIEIGSYRGQSVCAVGCGVRSSGAVGVRLFAIDLWTSKKGGKRTNPKYSSKGTWKLFNQNLAAFGLSDQVKAVMDESVHASTRRGRPIHLLYIDGDHSYEGCLADFNAWSHFVPVGGTIAFHDYKTRFRGVTNVIEQHVIPSGNWGDVDVYGRIWSAKRVK